MHFAFVMMSVDCGGVWQGMKIGEMGFKVVELDMPAKKSVKKPSRFNECVRKKMCTREGILNE